MKTLIADEQDSNASGDLKDYYDYIYTIKVDRIEIEYNGTKFDPKHTSFRYNLRNWLHAIKRNVCTDRQNVEPWIYSNTEWKDPWRKLLAVYKGAGDVISLSITVHTVPKELESL